MSDTYDLRQPRAATARCAHCDGPIRGPSVERSGLLYCCEEHADHADDGE